MYTPIHNNYQHETALRKINTLHPHKMVIPKTFQTNLYVIVPILEHAFTHHYNSFRKLNPSYISFRFCEGFPRLYLSLGSFNSFTIITVISPSVGVLYLSLCQFPYILPLAGSVHQQSLENRPAVFSTREGEQKDDDSYIGYSTVVGHFKENEQYEGVAVGMPRGNRLRGKVCTTSTSADPNENPYIFI